jgi:hypothetical protein
MEIGERKRSGWISSTRFKGFQIGLLLNGMDGLFEITGSGRISILRPEKIGGLRIS